MHVPKPLFKQIKLYEANGFHAVEITPRAGSHWRVRFREFTEPQFITKNGSDPRALKNNIARFKRLANSK